jgi:protoheme IX farnesyltransferase
MNRLTQEVIVPLEVAHDEPESGIMGDLLVLTKARLSLLVIVTTFVGFCMGTRGAIGWLLLISVTSARRSPRRCCGPQSVHGEP